jgi:hypothetical protein
MKVVGVMKEGKFVEAWRSLISELGVIHLLATPILLYHNLLNTLKGHSRADSNIDRLPLLNLLQSIL